MSEQAAGPGPDLDEYRAGAAAWLAANVAKREGPRVHHDIDHYTPEVMAASRALQRKLFDAGYAGISWPVEYGGQGLTPEHEAAFNDEAEAYEMPDWGILTGTTFHICVPTILGDGQPEFLREFIPKVLKGEALVCQFFSEPSSGSDMAGARTRATRDGDEWVINGQKIWSTYAHLADWGFCLARTNWDVPKHQGLTWFAIPCDAPGLTIRPILQINETSEFCEDFFDDVRVPDRQRVGDVDGGWGVTQRMLVLERGAGGEPPTSRLVPGELDPQLVGLARDAGRTDEPVVRQLLARAHTNAFVGRVLNDRIAQMARLGQVDAGTAAYSKLFLGTYTPIRARIAVEVAGPSALAWEPGDEAGKAASLTYLDGRIMSIAGGTNEMQRNAIGERCLGLPREPSFDSTKPYTEVLRNAKGWSGKV